MQALIIGTAGHIDHGKSALVKALTGTDPDRLAEEQARGMTIDIGFAFLNENIAFIDVPGHERFIKNMVTGASTVDFAMLVVAADDGVMPQTREHLEILKLLAIRTGIIVLNKIDLVSNDWLEMVGEDVRQLVKGTFLNSAPVFKTSTVSGAGIAELRQFLTELPARMPEVKSTGLFRLPVDRVFSMKGFGTVVTGTVLSGTAQVGDELEVMPSGRKTRIRGIQSHNDVLTAIARGRRAALNLAGVTRKEIERGMIVASLNAFRKTNLLTVFVELLPDAPAVKYNDQLRLHLGTDERIVKIRLIGRDRLKPGTGGVAQLLFDQPVTAGFRDRFILRLYSPLMTVGGGIVLENHPAPLRKKESAIAAEIRHLLDAGDEEWLKWFMLRKEGRLTTAEELAQDLTVTTAEIQPLLATLIGDNVIRENNGNLIAADRFLAAEQKILATLDEFHRRNPLQTGLDKATLYTHLGLDESLGNWLAVELVNAGKIQITGEKFKMTGFAPQLTEQQTTLLERVAVVIAQAWLTPPTLEELSEQMQIAPEELRHLLNLLIEQQKIVLIERIFPFAKVAIELAEERLTEFLKGKSGATVSELKDALGVSRKFAVPLLNYFDRKGVTVRVGDARKLG
ncbi:MAG: selenocysteine-specific translation elongation factor [Candidatus Neomarinimicrobiota bacterium]